MGLPVILLACLLKIPYFAEVNGLVVANSGKASQKVKQFYKTWLESRILRLAGVIIVPSNTLKKRVIDRYRVSSKRIYEVQNGFNELMFYPRNTRTSLGRELKFVESDFIVGFIGSMGEWQGIEVLKEAMQQAILRDASIKFLLVGDYTPDSSMKKIRSSRGDGARNIADFIKTKGYEGNVVYHRFVTYESSADFMNCCDVLVAPYTAAYQELGGGSPMKLYAYLACARPVIISDLGEWTDSLALKKHNAAYLIAPDDSQALVNAIIELKANENLRKQLGRSGRNFVLRERRWSHSSAKIMDIYYQKLNNLC
jgi:glycosyltransferase involved in cell wall biosynthesis